MWEALLHGCGTNAPFLTPVTTICCVCCEENKGCDPELKASALHHWILAGNLEENKVTDISTSKSKMLFHECTDRV